MDQRQIGAFIAQLRREQGWTQEELGGRLGVTNKTVSRWENGNYMPDIEMLSLLGQTFHVSLNELVQGRRLEDGDFRSAAEENLSSALERPGMRLWRWLERYMLSVTAVLLLGLCLAAACFANWSYQKAHPADAFSPGSYSSGPLGQGVCLVFDQQGRFWRYRQGEEDFLEQGSYTRREDKVTVTTHGGAVYQLLVKGDALYEQDGAGQLISYQRFFDYPIFICCGPGLGTVPPE